MSRSSLAVRASSLLVFALLLAQDMPAVAAGGSISCSDDIRGIQRSRGLRAVRLGQLRPQHDPQASAAAEVSEMGGSGALAVSRTAYRRTLLQTGCFTIYGYKTLVDMDHPGDDLASYGNIGHAVGNCTSNPTCRGLNGAGVTKSVVIPTTPTKGSCLYTKIPAECKDSNNATLGAHNKYRALHGAPPLTWSDKLASEAQGWANYLAAGRQCALQHYTGGPDGENLYASFSPSKIPAANCVPAVNAWYKEVNRYRFTAKPYTDNKPQFSSIGHFTQLIWKSTSQLGCGAAKGNGGLCYVVVCRYSSAGNFPNDASYLANVAAKK